MGRNFFSAKRLSLVIMLGAMIACSGTTTPATSSAKPPETIVYAPTVDIYCATDAAFLDASPLTSPANFAQVEAGTPMMMMGSSSPFAGGKFYYILSAGGRQQIYVYRETFEQKFKKLGELNELTKAEKSGAKQTVSAKADKAINRELEATQRKRAEQAAERERQKQAKDKADRTRVWKSPNGKFSVEAEFVGYSNGEVRLRKSDGEEIEVPAAKLSEEDNAWIEARR